MSLKVKDLIRSHEEVGLYPFYVIYKASEYNVSENDPLFRGTGDIVSRETEYAEMEISLYETRIVWGKYDGTIGKCAIWVK